MNPGKQTTEFWLTIIAIALDAIGAILSVIPHDQVGVLAMASVAAYNVSRGLAKMRQVPQGQIVKVTPTAAGGSVTVTHTPDAPSP